MPIDSFSALEKNRLFWKKIYIYSDSLTHSGPPQQNNFSETKIAAYRLSEGKVSSQFHWLEDLLSLIHNVTPQPTKKRVRFLSSHTWPTNPYFSTTHHTHTQISLLSAGHTFLISFVSFSHKHTLLSSLPHTPTVPTPHHHIHHHFSDNIT